MDDPRRAEDPIAQLVALFARLPGVGERTATRYVHHLLAEERSLSVALGESLGTLHARVHRCIECGNWGPSERCAICLDPRRDRSMLCVVARVPDLVALERGGVFRGRYHVLHALLAPLDGMGPERIDVVGLAERVTREGVREVVIATPLSVEGEATALYISQSLAPLKTPGGEPVRVSRIASGIPHGGELEYADPITLGRALEGRRSV